MRVLPVKEACAPVRRRRLTVKAHAGGRTPRERGGGTPGLRVGATLWFASNGDRALQPRDIELLESIEQSGSMQRAAAALGISYRTAWCALDRMNRHDFGPMVTKSRAGRRRGTRLTPNGRALVRQFRAFETELSAFVEGLSRRL